MFTDFRLKFNNFIRRNKWKIIIAIIGWIILISISAVISNIKISMPIISYKPYEPIIDNGQTTPSKWQSTIENTIKEYIDYCNNKEYEKAYEMISPNARKMVYPTLQDFKMYVDYVFSQKRIYSIQNYSNRDNVYIYRVRISEDIMATGLTYTESFKYFEEKFTFTESNGKLIMGVKGYIADEELDTIYEDQYIRISVANKNTTYDEETYTIKIRNKTDYTIVISNDEYAQEIQLETERGTVVENKEETHREFYAGPRGNSIYYATFTKFYDEGIKSTGLKLNNIRVLRSYSGNTDSQEQNSNNEVELYSVTIPLK